MTFTGPNGTKKVEATALHKLFGDMEVQNEVLMKPQGNLQGDCQGKRRQETKYDYRESVVGKSDLQMDGCSHRMDLMLVG